MPNRTIKTGQTGVRFAHDVVHPELNTSFKLQDARKHYLASQKKHRKQEFAALENVLAKIVTGSRSKATRQTNVDSIRTLVKSMFRALNIKL